MFRTDVRLWEFLICFLKRPGYQTQYLEKFKFRGQRFAQMPLFPNAIFGDNYIWRMAFSTIAPASKFEFGELCFLAKAKKSEGETLGQPSSK